MDRHWLLLETSGRDGLVGLGLGTTVVAERRLDGARRHAQDLGPAMAAALKEMNWRASMINAVGVGLGPGSYTGLRVGVMAAQAFAYARNCCWPAYRLSRTRGVLRWHAPNWTGLPTAVKERFTCSDFGAGQGSRTEPGR